MKHIDKLATPFASYARFLMRAKGRRSEALELAKTNYALPSVQEILKSAVDAATTSDQQWATSLAPYRSVSEAFLGSLAPFGAMDRILSDGAFKSVPMHSRIAVTTMGATGGTFGEREIKTPTKVQLENAELKLRKCAAFVVASDELLRLGGASALALLSGELRRAVAVVYSSPLSQNRPAHTAHRAPERLRRRSRPTLPRRSSILNMVPMHGSI